MLGIIKKIEDLFKSLVEETEVVKKEREKIAVKLTEQADTSILLRSKEGELQERENAVKFIEDIQALNVETKTAQDQLKKDRTQFFIEQKAFNDYQEQEKQTHAARAASLESSIKATKEKGEKYDALLVELEEKKKNLVEEVTKELLNRKA